jgi:hypothetical protein
LNVEFKASFAKDLKRIKDAKLKDRVWKVIYLHSFPTP